MTVSGEREEEREIEREEVIYSIFMYMYIMRGKVKFNILFY